MVNTVWSSDSSYRFSLGWQTVTVSGVGSFVSVVYSQIQNGRFCVFSSVFLG